MSRAFFFCSKQPHGTVYKLKSLPFQAFRYNPNRFIGCCRRRKMEDFMPKNKFQSVIFTLMMVFCMVFCMTVYTVALGAGGLTYSVFLTAIKEMWIEYVIVFVLIFFLISPTAVKLGHRFVNQKTDSPLLVIVSIQCFTVMMIVPAITLIVTFIHNGFTAAWFTQWITTAAKCFPAALFLQVFYIGPLVRTVFRAIFDRKTSVAAPEVFESVPESE